MVISSLYRTGHLLILITPLLLCFELVSILFPFFCDFYLTMRIEEMEPLITVGAAFALSVAGYFMSNRQSKPTNSIRATRSESDLSKMGESSISVGPSRCPVTGTSHPASAPGTCPKGFKRGLRIIGNEDAHINVIQRSTVPPVPHLPPLPEEKEEETSISNESDQPCPKETDIQEPIIDSEMKTEKEEEKNNISEKEEEIERLRALAQSLLEKERSLEMQMLEYYGLKEQEEAMRDVVRELEVNSAETKYLAHKVESLEEENERLKRQILEMENMRNKLDSNKGKITTLKRRLRLEDENAQEKIVLLRQRIEVLAEKNNKNNGDYEEIESKLARVKELEEEVNQLRKINSQLGEENSGLTQRLENAQLLASHALNAPKELEEAGQLRETNEKLEKEIDQLRDDHSSSVEEIVYLRWLNACLRYEMRNFNNPSKNHSIARDLNKSPSHNSKEIVKQLILEYSNQGIDIHDPNFDFEFPNSPFSPDSNSSMPAQNPDKSTSKGKNKKHGFLNSIKKMVTGNKHKNSNANNKGKPPLLSPDSASYTCSNNSSPLSSITINEPSFNNFHRSENHARASLNIDRSKIELENARSRSDLGSRFVGKETTRYQSLHLDHPSIDFDVPENKEINKYGRALSASPSR